MSLPRRTPLDQRVKVSTAEQVSLLEAVPDLEILERIVESLRAGERSVDWGADP